MLSILNYTAYKCFDRETCEPINKKARYLSDILPWVDMAIGIILLILGGLAQYMMIPAPIETILKAVGWTQLSVGVFMRIARPCINVMIPMRYNQIRTNWDKIKDEVSKRCPC